MSYPSIGPCSDCKKNFSYSNMQYFASEMLVKLDHKKHIKGRRFLLDSAMRKYRWICNGCSKNANDLDKLRNKNKVDIFKSRWCINKCMWYIFSKIRVVVNVKDKYGNKAFFVDQESIKKIKY